MAIEPRLWLSSATPALGDVVQLRTMIRHPMESGLRVQSALPVQTGLPLQSGLRDQQEALIPRNIINRFTCHLDQDLLFLWQPETAVAQNPYLEFRFIAQRSGLLRLLWRDDQGIEITAEKAITLRQG